MCCCKHPVDTYVRSFVRSFVGSFGRPVVVQQHNRVYIGYHSPPHELEMLSFGQFLLDSVVDTLDQHPFEFVLLQ